MFPPSFFVACILVVLIILRELGSLSMYLAHSSGKSGYKGSHSSGKSGYKGSHSSGKSGYQEV
jgi:hypothetical protein